MWKEAVVGYKVITQLGMTEEKFKEPQSNWFLGWHLKRPSRYKAGPIHSIAIFSSVLLSAGYVYKFENSYKVRQFNSQNSPVKAKFAYLCPSSCSRLQNTLLVKLCTSWDDGATAGNSLENRFPEYLAVTSRCLGCQECQQIIVPSGHFLIFERAKNCRG
jgi:hypothetical protein